MPIIVMTMMGFSSYREGRKRILESLKEEASVILQTNTRLLVNSLSLLEEELNPLALNSSQSPDELRAEMNRRRLVRQAFIIDSSGTFLFPDSGSSISEKEADFLAEAEKIDLASNLRAGYSRSEDRTEGYRWYTWFMGDGINFILYTIENGETRGFLLERYALLSRLINVLPASGDTDRSFRIQLTDARGNILYQWGGYIPAENDLPLSETSLKDPLGSWRLYYYGNPEMEVQNTGNAFSMIPALGILTLLILMLAVYFYRESTREMRTAQNQVSFVNQVTHELKTPLTNIRLYSELLQDRLTDPKEKGYLDVIVQEGSRLGRMINNVLTFSRGERGELKKRIETVNLNDLVVEILHKFIPLLKEQGMEYDCSKSSLPDIETDRDMLEQILVNLIGNAVKYGSSGKYLGIHWELNDRECRILISDRGPGIEHSEREKIFKPFYRIDNSLSQSTSGTGIGLSIARTLARESGYTLALEKSEKGACFSLTIPLKEGLL